MHTRPQRNGHMSPALSEQQRWSRARSNQRTSTTTPNHIIQPLVITQPQGQVRPADRSLSRNYDSPFSHN